MMALLIVTVGCGGDSGGTETDAGRLPPNGDAGAAVDPCADDDPETNSGLVTPPVPVEAGDHLLNVTWRCDQRRVVVTIPASYDPEGEHPLIALLHGNGSNAVDLREKREELVPLAAAEGAVLVFLEGALKQDGGGRVWNAWDKPWYPADDVGFVSAALAWIADDLALSRERRYIAGFSNGAAMTQRFAAERPDEVRAVVAMNHSVWANEPSAPGQEICACDRACSPDCPVVMEDAVYTIPEPVAPIPILTVRGLADQRVCSRGGCSDRGVEYGTAEDQRAFWLSANGCAEDTYTEATILSGSLARRYDDCADGTALVSILDPALGHSWPVRYDQLVLDFLLEW